MKIKRILKWTFSLILIALVAWGFIAYWSSSNDCDRYATVPAHPIKAIVYCDYGVPSLKLQEIEKPVPNDDQILIRVRAASLNPLDWHYVEGTPYIMRIGVGLRKPKETRLGVDYAGTIEAVGKNVTNFKPGDEVYGGRTGAFAEYLCARAAGSLALKPAKLSFEEAASVPIAGITALQALRDKGKLQAGEKVLINGASGGVGTFAVQIAKAYGARVTGVCSTRNLEMVRSLGAEQTIDYTQADFTQGDERYDLLLDNVGNRSLSECRRVLTPRGRYVMIGGGSATNQGVFGEMLRPLRALVYSWFISQKMGMMLADLKPKDLATLAEMMQSGKVKPVIDRQYKLQDVPEAIRYLEAGHARGKVIITID